MKQGQTPHRFVTDLLEGEADRVREMTEAFHRADDIEFVKLLIA